MMPRRVMLHLAVLAFFPGVAGLGGCGASAGASKGSSPHLPALPLPPPESLGYEIDAHQRVDIRHGKHASVFEARLRVEPERLSLVALDSFGNRTMSIVWTGIAVEQQGRPLPEPIGPENVIGDLCAIYWPREALEKAYGTIGARIEDSATSRRAVRGDQEIFRVDYVPDHAGAWSGTALYANALAGYDIEVRSVRLSP